MSLYSDAVTALRRHVECTQAALDEQAARARAENVAAQREVILAWEPEDPWRPVMELLAHTLQVGREDGYPALTIPEATQAVLRAAIKADMPRHGSLHSDGSGFAAKPDPEAWDADYKAWVAADAYRRDTKAIADL